MYQLLLDSSNKYLAVGLAKDGQVIDQIFYDAWQRQSEMMVTEIDNILKRNNCTRNDLDAVVVGKGPGSYTGVRISITIAKTIAFVLKIKLYAVSSLSLLKIEDKPTICLFNARSGRSYVGVYKGDEVILEDTVLTNEQSNAYIDEHPSYLLAGDTEQLGKKSETFNIIKNLAKSMRKSNEIDPFRLSPAYLKDLTK